MVKPRVIMDCDVGRYSRNGWVMIRGYIGLERMMVSVLVILSNRELWENQSVISVSQLKIDILIELESQEMEKEVYMCRSSAKRC